MTEVIVDPDRATQLRDQVADELIEDGTITSKQVETAMRTVPRHLFAPEANLDEAYRAYNAVFTPPRPPPAGRRRPSHNEPPRITAVPDMLS